MAEPSSTISPISFQHLLASSSSTFTPYKTINSDHYPCQLQTTQIPTTKPFKISSQNPETSQQKMKKTTKPIVDDKKEEAVTIRAVSGDEEGRKRVEKTEVNTHKIDTLKYVEKKLMDKGVLRMDRHPADGIGIGKPPPKSGHGGKYTWEGPDDIAESELSEVPPAIDEKDPNYVDEEEEEKILQGEKSEVAGLVVGVVEVPKVVEEKEGVARIEVDPRLNV